MSPARGKCPALVLQLCGLYLCMESGRDPCTHKMAVCPAVCVSGTVKTRAARLVGGRDSYQVSL